MPHINRPFAAGAAIIAAFSLGTPQAIALDIPMTTTPVNYAASDISETLNYDRYGRYNRYDRHRHGNRHRHRRGGIGAGSVVAGVLVIGAIAAIAGAANSNRDSRRERVDTYPRRDDVRYRDNRGSDRRSGRSSDSRGIDSAVDICIEQVERGDTRIDSVDNATRAADGWRVSGALSTGEGWNCWIDNDGRVRSVDLGGEFSAASQGDVDGRFSGNTVRFESAAAAGDGKPQMSDAAYARARAGQPAVALDADLRGREEELRAAEADYPGGPVEGELYPGGEWVDDGRYTSADSVAAGGRS